MKRNRNHRVWSTLNEEGTGGRGGLRRGRATQGQREESLQGTQHRCQKRKDGAITEGVPEEVARRTVEVRDERRGGSNAPHLGFATS